MSASCKKKDALLQKHYDHMGQRQETSLARPGDTRWWSHHRTLIRIHQIWDSVILLLDSISHGGIDVEERGLTSGYMINIYGNL
jgi:hypothetical protein